MLDSCGLESQSWKKQRGYFLADQVELVGQNSISISGYLKGACVNANQIVHITGFEDYHIEKIEICSTKAKQRFSMQTES